MPTVKKFFNALLIIIVIAVVVVTKYKIDNIPHSAERKPIGLTQQEKDIRSRGEVK